VEQLPQPQRAPISTPPPGYADPLAARPPAPPPPPADGRPAWLWLAAATVLALAAFAFVSLRGDDSGGGPFSPVAEAAERTANSPGARFAGTGTATASGITMNMRFTGEFNGATERTIMRMDVTSNVASPVAQQLSPIVGIQDGLTTYMSVPLLAGQLPDDKSWMKLDLSEVVSEEVPQSGTDARALLRQLEAVGDAAEVGTERVRGVRTTRYRVTVDPEAQAEQLREAGDDLAADLIEQNGGTSYNDVWVDRRGYVRRLTTTVPFELVGGSGSQMSMTMDFFDFGVAPQIDLPPEDDTFDATELAIEGLEAELGG
jgi:hypothetical protein